MTAQEGCSKHFSKQWVFLSRLTRCNSAWWCGVLKVYRSCVSRNYQISQKITLLWVFWCGSNWTENFNKKGRSAKKNFRGAFSTNIRQFSALLQQLKVEWKPVNWIYVALIVIASHSKIAPKSDRRIYSKTSKKSQIFVIRCEKYETTLTSIVRRYRQSGL